MRQLLILCLAAASLAATAETYRWVDSAGRTVLSDTPPPSKTKALVKADDTASGNDSVPYATRKAAENFPVTLYTSADCKTACQQARDLLNGRGVPFTEKALQKQEDVDELKQLVGDSFVPALRVGKQSSRGFEAGAYNNLLDLAGYPKSAPYGSKPPGGSSK